MSRGGPFVCPTNMGCRLPGQIRGRVARRCKGVEVRCGVRMKSVCYILYRVTSLVKQRTPLGPYRRIVPWILGKSWGVGVFSWVRYPCTPRGGPITSYLEERKLNQSQFLRYVGI
jgi:hypothetical protein